MERRRQPRRRGDGPRVPRHGGRLGRLGPCPGGQGNRQRLRPGGVAGMSRGETQGHENNTKSKAVQAGLSSSRRYTMWADGVTARRETNEGRTCCLDQRVCCVWLMRVKAELNVI